MPAGDRTSSGYYFDDYTCRPGRKYMPDGAGRGRARAGGPVNRPTQFELAQSGLAWQLAFTRLGLNYRPAAGLNITVTAPIGSP